MDGDRLQKRIALIALKKQLEHLLAAVSASAHIR